jgi:hypothetical protein
MLSILPLPPTLVHFVAQALKGRGRITLSDTQNTGSSGSGTPSHFWQIASSSPLFLMK